MKKLIISLLLLGLYHSVFAQDYQKIDQIVAVVNDDVVTRSELDREVDALRERLSQQKARLPSRTVFEKQVLDRIILIRLQLQQAQRSGIRVDDTLLNDALRQLASDKGMRLSQYRDAVTKNGQTFAEFREILRKELMMQQLRQRGVARKVKVSQREIQYFLDNQNRHEEQTSEYHLLHIRLDIPENADSDVVAKRKQDANDIIKKLSAGESFNAMALTYSDGNTALEGGDLGWLPLAKLPTLFVKVAQNMKVDAIQGPLRSSSGFHIIKLAGKRGLAESTIIQTDVRHILLTPNEFLSSDETEKKLEDLYQRIAAGEDFASLAKAHSQDTASATAGGDLGWVDAGTMVASFEKVMQTIELNTVSVPFRSQFGWHILEVKARRSHDNTLAAQQAQARKQIRERKTESAFQDWLRRLRDEAYIELRLDS